MNESVEQSPRSNDVQLQAYGYMVGNARLGLPMVNPGNKKGL